MAHKSWLAVTCVVIALVAGVAYWQVAGRKTDSTALSGDCLLYTSPSPRDRQKSRMPSSA